jgi:hypothetical protein
MFLLLVFVPVTIFVSMAVIYLEVASQEAQTNRYRFSFTRRGSLSAQRNTIAARNRATAYSLAWFLTWAMYFAIILYMTIMGNDNSTPFLMAWFHVALYPLQGLFNFLVYLQPRLTERLRHYEQQRIAQPKRFLLAVRDALTSRGRIPTIGRRSDTYRRGQSSLYLQSRAQLRRRSLLRISRQNALSNEGNNDIERDEPVINNTELNQNIKDNCTEDVGVLELVNNTELNQNVEGLLGLSPNCANIEHSIGEK